MAITVKELRAIKEGVWLSDSAGRGAGVLRFRKTGGIIRAYFRYTQADGSRYALPLGQYDEAGRDGFTLVGARERAGELTKLYQSGVKDIREHLAAEEQARRDADEATKQAHVQTMKQAQARAQFTLGALCEAYGAMLEGNGKSKGAKDARAVFKVHLFESNAELANTPANEVQPEQIADALKAIRAVGKHRTAGILRSYLNAAFNVAIRARLSTDASADFNGFDIRTNPVTAIEAIKVRAGTRVLNHGELRGYLLALGDSIVDQALQLALLAGGQRMAQLLRARANDWDHGMLRLWDDKGRRDEPREHLLPLGPRGVELVEGLITRARERSSEQNPSLFISTGGAQVVDTTPGKRLADVAASLGCEPFNLRDIRRTVETELQRLRISRDVRGVLLSHGLGGVQGKHYERFDFMDEKRAALIAWERHLDQIRTGAETGNVVPMRGAA